MSIANEVRAYADSALAQGKQVISRAQSGVTVAGRTVSVNTVTSAVEPYVAQARGYRATAQQRADALLTDLKGDPRVEKALEAGQTVYGTVYDTVRERLVKPVGEAIARTPLVSNPTVENPTVAKPAAPTRPATVRTASAKPAPEAAPAPKAPAKRAAPKKTAE
jgi:hypothetical protein